MPVQREYLGDSVYADDDGFEVTLYLDNGEGRHSVIVLEPEVLQSLESYLARVKLDRQKGDRA